MFSRQVDAGFLGHIGAEELSEGLSGVLDVTFVSDREALLPDLAPRLYS